MEFTCAQLWDLLLAVAAHCGSPAVWCSWKEAAQHSVKHLSELLLDRLKQAYRAVEIGRRQLVLRVFDSTHQAVPPPFGKPIPLQQFLRELGELLVPPVVQASQWERGSVEVLVDRYLTEWDARAGVGFETYKLQWKLPQRAFVVVSCLVMTVYPRFPYPLAGRGGGRRDLGG